MPAIWKTTYLQVIQKPLCNNNEKNQNVDRRPGFLITWNYEKEQKNQKIQ